MINNTILWAAAWAETARTRVAGALHEERGQGIMEYGIDIGQYAIALIGAGAPPSYVAGVGTQLHSVLKQDP